MDVLDGLTFSFRKEVYLPVYGELNKDSESSRPISGTFTTVDTTALSLVNTRLMYL